MKMMRASITALGLALLLSACGGSNNSSGSGGATASSGGSTGSSSGGTTGSSSGGSTGSSSGGSSGTASGGAIGMASGGNPGTGGSTPTSSGGKPGPTGSGGAAPAGSGGAGPTSSGGAAPSGSGGMPSTGSGGANPIGSGGVDLPALVISGPNSYWQTSTMASNPTSGNADVTVNDGTTYQTWDGMGGAFNEMGWDDLMQLSEGDRDHAIKLLFSPTEGAGFIFGRIPIGASDYAIDRYTDDETAGDYTMDHFSIDRDKMRLVPYVQAALGVNPKLRLWGSPWTPPTWMKDNSDFNGGNMKDDAKILQALALYLVKWVQAYGDQGIPVEAIHPQNEPGYSTGYPSCLWTSALYTKFIGQYLGPTFTMMNVNAKIYLGTMSNGDSGKDPSIVSAVLADATAMKYIAGFGFQWGMLSSVSGVTSKKLPVMQTEHKAGNYPFSQSGETPPPGPFNMNMAPNDHTYAMESWGLIRDWVKAGVNSYSAWNMVLDNIGNGVDSGRAWPQNALLTVDRSAKKLPATPAYYVFRHISQYVRAGATRVATSGLSDALAFKNPDGGLVTVLYNSATSMKTITVSMGGTRYQFPVPGTGFATVIKKP